MDKSEILEAIKRLARENGGKAPGSAVVQSRPESEKRIGTPTSGFDGAMH
jgi:hypothetical protein